MENPDIIPDFFWHFDLDGTLFDTKNALIESYSVAVVLSGGTWTDEASESLVSGTSAEVFLNLCIWRTDFFDVNEVRRIKEGIYLSLMNKVKPNVPLLNLALKLSPNIGIVTSSSRKSVDSILHYQGLTDCFRNVISSDDVKEVKPSPELYLLSVARNPARNHIAVEDSSAGKSSASEAGLLVFMVDFT